MTSVQSVGTAQVSNKKFLDSPNKYTGLKVGATAAAAVLATTTGLDIAIGNAKFSKFLIRASKVIPLYIVPAFIVDYLNNDQKQNTEPNAKTEKGNDYVKVNMGEKWGAVLGCVVGILSGLININEIKAIWAKNASKFGPIAGTIIGVCATALGGHWLGIITDKYTNKQAAKVADEQK